MTVRPATGLLALFVAAWPGPASAAFEAPGPDPRTLALGSAGPAWPSDGRLSASQGGAFVFGHSPRMSAAAATLRWDAVPELAQDGMAMALPLGAFVVAVRAGRFGFDSYGETAISAELARPVDGAGWGWSLAAGRESWAASNVGGESGWTGLAQLGFAPWPGFRTAVKVVERIGSITRSARGSLEVGLSCDPIAGWRLGAGYETARTGGFGRMKLGVECLAADRLSLRMGLVPSDATVSTGLGCRVGVITVDVARRAHPRLGAMQALSVQFGGGRP